jgi:glycolate oxidase iron-sulfur subunit
MVKDYGKRLRHDAAYAARAAQIAAMTRSIGEVLAAEGTSLVAHPRVKSMAFHSPCTLQHGQRLPGLVEGLLSRLGFALTAVEDAHLCCGSAGTYSILQPDLSERLLANKIKALEQGNPEVIATDNIGCLLHLRSATERPVKHWVEVLAEALDHAE